MATSSFPQTPDILYSSISGLMPIRLDSTKFFVRKYLMTTIFRAHNLLGYVDGSIRAASISQGYETWMAHDAGVMFRSDLETITKGGDSVHAYVQRIEEIRDKLAGFDVVVDDAEIMVHAQRGLPTEYNDFRASMAARNGEALSLDGFYVLLLEEEAALTARSQYQFPQFADAQWSSNQCQICNEAGHTALVCPQSSQNGFHIPGRTESIIKDSD
ncbi:hypothetical protein M0R45_036494 [Rubus argutus]|uniref:CCHC-type domain-containing protein n=1 Tax=Rubus argutus TaxID=59490 RepID=A0AAW1VZP3_RUBAR